MELEAAILRHDDALSPPRGSAPAPPAATAPTAVPPRRDRRRRLAAAARSPCSPQRRSRRRVRPPRRGRTDRRSSELVAAIDPATNRVVTAILQTGIRPGPVAGGEGSVWVGEPRRQVADSRRSGDPQSGGDDPIPATPTAIAVGRGAVWVVNGRLGTVYRVDPQFGRAESGRVRRPLDQAHGSRSRPRRGIGLGCVRRIDTRASPPRDARRLGRGHRGRRAGGAGRRVRLHLGRNSGGRNRSPFHSVDLRPRRRGVAHHLPRTERHRRRRRLDLGGVHAATTAWRAFRRTSAPARRVRSRSGTGRRRSRSAPAPCGWRTPAAGRCLGSTRDERGRRPSRSATRLPGSPSIDGRVWVSVQAPLDERLLEARDGEIEHRTQDDAADAVRDERRFVDDVQRRNRRDLAGEHRVHLRVGAVSRASLRKPIARSSSARASFERRRGSVSPPKSCDSSRRLRYACASGMFGVQRTSAMSHLAPRAVELLDVVHARDVFGDRLDLTSRPILRAAAATSCAAWIGSGLSLVV